MLEPAVEFDACPMLRLGLLRWADHRQDFLSKPFGIQFAGAARTGPGNQPVNAARVEQMHPTQQLAGTDTTQGERSLPGFIPIQLPDGLQPDENLLGRSAIHRPLDFFECGVLAIELQPWPSHDRLHGTLPSKVQAFFDTLFAVRSNKSLFGERRRHGSHPSPTCFFRRRFHFRLPRGQKLSPLTSNCCRKRQCS